MISLFSFDFFPSGRYALLPRVGRAEYSTTH
jgi:hypothetical protein